MKFPNGELIHSCCSEFQNIEVSQSNDLRMLRTDKHAVQSALLLNHPQQLFLPYMQGMMTGLLFQPPPNKVLLLGLGGGDLVRYINHYLPKTSITAVELDAAMLEVSREYFALPDSDSIDIYIDDAMHYLNSNNACYEMILTDIYGGTEMPEILQNRRFYQHCYNRLEQNGLLILNMLISDAETFKQILWKIRQQFHRSTLCLTIPDHSNIIVFAFKQRPTELILPTLLKKAEHLNKSFELDFSGWAQQLFSTNPAVDGELIFEMEP